jgi:hypothetical protein
MPRGLIKVALVAAAVISWGCFLLLFLPATIPVVTGIVNYCPAELFVTGSVKSDKIMATIARYVVLGSPAHKH